MISKMNYLLLSTMMVVAIDSTFGSCCPCWKEEGEWGDFTTKINELITYIADTNNTETIEGGGNKYNEDIIKDDVKAQENNDDVNGVILEHGIRNMDKHDDEFTKKDVDGSHQAMNTGNHKSIIYENDGNTKLDDSTVLNTNPVIGQNATGKYTNVKMGSTSGGGNLENDYKKNDIKPKVEYDKRMRMTLLFMKFLEDLCSKDGCDNGDMVHLNMITVDNTNATQETGIDLQLCKQHNICHMCDSHGGQTRRPEFLIPCGHMFCSSHYIVDVGRILCTECGITLCGCFSEEYDHQICMPTPRTVHYLCHKNSNLGKHIVYTEIRYCEKHNQMFTAYELDPKRKYKKTKKIYKKV